MIGCIVVRHLTPAEEDIVHGGCAEYEEEEIYCRTAKRPYRKLEVQFSV